MRSAEDRWGARALLLLAGTIAGWVAAPACKPNEQTTHEACEAWCDHAWECSPTDPPTVAVVRDCVYLMCDVPEDDEGHRNCEEEQKAIFQCEARQPCDLNEHFLIKLCPEEEDRYAECRAALHDTSGGSST